jgi:O-antigen/teichoic acid export membrane protein
MNDSKSAIAGRLSGRLVLSGISVFSRLLAGVVLFIFLARTMGPESFGNFMYAMSIATLLAFPAALGFGPQVLRETAANPNRAAQTTRDISFAKVVLSFLVFLSVCIVCIEVAPEWGFPVIALTWVAIADSFTEYFFCIQRAKGVFAIEAAYMGFTSLAHFAIVLVSLTYSADILWIACIFAASRSVQMLGAFMLTRGHLRTPQDRLNVLSALQTFKKGFAYAGDSALSTVTAHIDTIILKHTLGAHDTGIYQAGMRLVIGFQNFAVVAGNVFVPQLASQYKDLQEFSKVAKKVQLVFAALAVALALMLLAAGFLFIKYGYGESFNDVEPLLPALAGLIALRMLAAGQGVQLTALGDQKYRTLVNCGALAFTVFGMWWASQVWGLQGAIYTLIFSALVVLVAYRNRTRRILVR